MKLREIFHPATKTMGYITCVYYLSLFINGYLHFLLCLNNDVLNVNFRNGHTGDLNTGYDVNKKVFEE